MSNLLIETESELEHCGKTWDDVEWIGFKDAYCISIENFKEIADKRYDDGFGHQIVPASFVIVGKDWWLERTEYDGSEEWEYKTIPEKPEKLLEITKEKFWKYESLDYCEYDEEGEDDEY